ncbi:MAG: hypothetical protein PHE67_04205 [Campylobacterales bacterium]|nr:hypothetical protein [Campylobacterales bacterium]
MSFANELKIAIVNMDIKKLDELSGTNFESSNLAEMQEVAALILEAIKVLEVEKTKTSNAMSALKKMNKYAQTLQYKDCL